MMKNIFYFILACLFMNFPSKGNSKHPDSYEITLGAGPASGLYFSLASIIGGIISKPWGAPPCNHRTHCGVEGLMTQIRATEGSLKNLALIHEGKIQSAFVQSDALLQNPEKDSLVIAPLYPEALHIITLKKSPISSLYGLKNKKIGIGEEGSGTKYTLSRVFESLKFQPPPESMISVSLSEACDKLMDGSLDAFFFLSGYPVPSIQELSKRLPIKLISLSIADQEKLENAGIGLSAFTIMPGAYRGIDAVTTVSVQALWVVSQNLSQEMVHKLLNAYYGESTSIIFDRFGFKKTDFIGDEHFQDSVLKQIKPFMHKGAAIYYKHQKAS
jgi:uncharacterized protein